MATLNPAIFGIWKERALQSQEPERRVTFERKEDGIHQGTDPNSLAFDGIDRPTRVPHNTRSWTKTGDRTYFSIGKRGGNTTMTVTRVISDDGNTMMLTNVSLEFGSRTTSVWKRAGVATDPEPLVGTWSMDGQSMKKETAARLVIERHEEVIAVSYGVPGRARAELVAKADGADYPWPPGTPLGLSAVCIQPVDDRSFVGTLKLGGQPFTIYQIVLSPDGRTLRRAVTLVSKTSTASLSMFERE